VTFGDYPDVTMNPTCVACNNMTGGGWCNCT